jgi:SAM-dependent methyltransferase
MHRAHDTASPARACPGPPPAAAAAGPAQATRSWQEIWRRRQVEVPERPVLADLLAADGYDNPFGYITEQAWRAMVRQWIATLGIKPGMTVFEIGCGSGAFLHEFSQLGCRVGGLDLSPSLIRLARSVMPAGDFQVADARSFRPREKIDVVVASGVFLYFPSRDYARSVLAEMAKAARHAVLVLDLPDLATEAEATASRIEAVGGPEEYAQRYRGLEHCYYDRADMTRQLAEHGFGTAVAEDVRIADYGNARFRFDLYGSRQLTGVAAP